MVRSKFELIRIEVDVQIINLIYNLDKDRTFSYLQDSYCEVHIHLSLYSGRE